DIGKTLHAAPCRSGVNALPQSVVARAQKQDVPFIGIDRQTFAVAATVLVAAELERHVIDLEGVATVTGTQNRAIRCSRVGVSAAGEIDTIGIGGINRNAFHPHQVPAGVGNPVQQRLPSFAPVIPAISAADIRTRVVEAFLGGMKNDPVDEPATHNLHALPCVRHGPRLAPGRLSGCPGVQSERRQYECQNYSWISLHQSSFAGQAAYGSFTTILSPL